MILITYFYYYIDYNPSDFAIISTKGTDDLDIDDTLQLKDKYGNILYLKLNIV